VFWENLLLALQGRSRRFILSKDGSTESSESLVHIYQITQHHALEGYNLDISCLGVLKCFLEYQNMILICLLA
jgi:hypothetical protein